MTPYYQDDAVTIYHGDCREVLPEIETGSVGLVLADPPYGIAHPTDFKARGRNTKGVQAFDYAPVVGDDKPFDPSTWIDYPAVILWGANYYANSLPDVSGWLVWDKRVMNGFSTDQADGELAWTNCVKGVRIFRHMWNGYLRDSEGQQHWHPTQKPVALMVWAIEKSKTQGLILDPYMGSGPVLLAARLLSRRAIGIEIEEKYCEIAARRMSQTVMTFDPAPLTNQ